MRTRRALSGVVTALMLAATACSGVGAEVGSEETTEDGEEARGGPAKRASVPPAAREDRARGFIAIDSPQPKSPGEGAKPPEIDPQKTPQWFVPSYGWGPGLGHVPPIAVPLWPTFFLAATLPYAGLTQWFVVPTGGAVATHVLLEASWFCAPKLTSAIANVAPLGTTVPLWNVGQRTIGGVVQALLLVGNGLATSVASIQLAFQSGFAVSCPVNVYVVRT